MTAPTKTQRGYRPLARDAAMKRGHLPLAGEGGAK
ncbi:hypothetical protein LAUMK7_04187 [Mycobacterium kansasii]|uniref:Uncharacterized protein n=2 Tax=Mycobacterium kansasii TaxID=1768 RepID=A0A653F095_MYCKA|nr:hypothetical protein MKAN_05635 [Mycobacterium kansasii ATCC 12478]VAZ61736.1 hypothetical protein LAUMK22_03552 [Mycobacterium kansasii]VAZ68071.1 hypothetical protein LAUMK40_04217 [Mycobacterium kansasii]VAZ78085.1 hypothetical protein LAUMK7_04187 [Mycobacterium kansasii]VTP02591.1 hypothetical protein BIN_B_03543 [Mycobacterium kansasii]